MRFEVEQPLRQRCTRQQLDDLERFALNMLLNGLNLRQAIALEKLNLVFADAKGVPCNDNTEGVKG